MKLVEIFGMRKGAIPMTPTNQIAEARKVLKRIWQDERRIEAVNPLEKIK